MLGTRRALLTAAFPGRNLIGWSCLFARSKQQRVHCSCSLDRQDTTQKVTSLKNNVKGNVDKAYTSQQRDTILQMLNTASESQLDCVKELQGKNAADIVQYREQYGSFQDLNTLQQVQDFQPALIRKVCDSMLSFSARSDRSVVAKFLKPDVPMWKLQETGSIVSIAVGLKKVAWTHIDRTMTVREWQQQESFCFAKGRYLTYIYLEEISSLISHLPQADLYILEKPSVSSQNSSLFPVVLHLRTMEAMLYCLLNPRFTKEGEHRVFSMNRNTVGKHFGIMVGESRTSGVDVVQTLINDAMVAPKPRVNFPTELVQQYRHQSQTRWQNRNEEMCDALLQGVTFYELIL